jgi:hypothetical protein
MSRTEKKTYTKERKTERKKEKEEEEEEDNSTVGTGNIPHTLTNHIRSQIWNEDDTD